MNNFGGTTPKESITNKIDALLSETQNENFPIKLSSIAYKIGINPKPIYCNQTSEGSVVIFDNHLRISLANAFRTARMRFVYAHELIHCLFFNLNAETPYRIAPEPKGLEEEHICNYGAKRLLISPHLLKRYFLHDVDRSQVMQIRFVASLAQVNIPLVVFQLFENNILPKESGKLYILSSSYEGYQNRNKKKPRCVAGIYYDKSGDKKMFLAPNQGLQHIVSKNSHGAKWSLMNCYDMQTNPCVLIKDEIIERDYDNHKFCTSGTHTKIPDTNFFWSELRISEFTTNSRELEFDDVCTNQKESPLFHSGLLNFT